MEIAVPTWKLLLKDRYKYIDEWCIFIEQEWKKAISKDTWDQFLDFTRQVGDNFEKYDPDGAWPVAVDEFYDWFHKRQKAA